MCVNFCALLLNPDSSDRFLKKILESSVQCKILCFLSTRKKDPSWTLLPDLIHFCSVFLCYWILVPLCENKFHSKHCCKCKYWQNPVKIFFFSTWYHTFPQDSVSLWVTWRVMILFFNLLRCSRQQQSHTQVSFIMSQPTDYQVGGEDSENGLDDDILECVALYWTHSSKHKFRSRPNEFRKFPFSV